MALAVGLLWCCGAVVGLVLGSGGLSEILGFLDSYWMELALIMGVFTQFFLNLYLSCFSAVGCSGAVVGSLLGFGELLFWL